MVIRRRTVIRRRATSPRRRRSVMITENMNTGTTVLTGAAAGHVTPIPLQTQWETVQSATMQGATLTGISGWIAVAPATLPVVAAGIYDLMAAARWDDRQVSSTAPGATLDGLRAINGTSTRYGPWVGRHLWHGRYAAGGTNPIGEMTQEVTIPVRFPLRGTATDEQKVPCVYLDNLTQIAGAAGSVVVHYYLVATILLP